MNHIKQLSLFVAVFVVLFSACAIIISDRSESNTTADSETEETTTPPKSTPSATEMVHITVEYATDALVSQYENITEFIEFEEEGYPKIIFTSNVAVKDFHFTRIDYNAEDAELSFFEAEILYTVEELSPEKPFVVTWIEQGTMPHRGISFADETGTMRYFCIVMSGEDGSLCLVEYGNK